MKIGIQLLVCLFILPSLFASEKDKVILKLQNGEYWWGGLSARGYEMPYSASTSAVKYNLYGDNQGNQAQPLLISNNGRYISIR